MAVAVKDVAAAHDFYTQAMGFELVKVVKRQTPDGGWTKHIFYDIGDGTLFAIWDLRGIEGVVIEADAWTGGMSTGVGLPYWVNHVAFQVAGRDDLEAKKQQWLDYGKNVVEVDHEFIVSIYTKDPDGTLVEWTMVTRALDDEDRAEAVRLLADDTPATQPDYGGTIFKSPKREALTAGSGGRD
jgi:catechol 2,3-dioxygenase-like lactoylglutathione lyase family enzyme